MYLIIQQVYLQVLEELLGALTELGSKEGARGGDDVATNALQGKGEQVPYLIRKNDRL